jgi:hypothetical protein
MFAAPRHSFSCHGLRYSWIWPGTNDTASHKHTSPSFSRHNNGHTGHFTRFVPSYSSCHSFAILDVNKYLARAFEAGTLSFYFLYFSFNSTMSLARAACRSVLTAARTQCFTIPTNPQVQCLGWRRILRPFSSEPPRPTGMCDPILSSFLTLRAGHQSGLRYPPSAMMPSHFTPSSTAYRKWGYERCQLALAWSLAQALTLPSQ